MCFCWPWEIHTGNSPWLIRGTWPLGRQLFIPHTPFSPGGLPCCSWKVIILTCVWKTNYLQVIELSCPQSAFTSPLKLRLGLCSPFFREQNARQMWSLWPHTVGFLPYAPFLMHSSCRILQQWPSQANSAMLSVPWEQTRGCPAHLCPVMGS